MCVNVVVWISIQKNVNRKFATRQIMLHVNHFLGGVNMKLQFLKQINNRHQPLILDLFLYALSIRQSVDVTSEALLYV